MFDEDRWDDLVAGRGCPLCAVPDETNIVTHLRSGRVVLTDDADFPGYCILIHDKHVTELFELSEPERTVMMDDIALIARVIKSHTEPSKINYAILGNIVPHLHCHVIPRFPGDSYWGEPIWSRPDTMKSVLPADEYAALMTELREAFELHGQP